MSRLDLVSLVVSQLHAYRYIAEVQAHVQHSSPHGFFCLPMQHYNWSWLPKAAVLLLLLCLAGWLSFLFIGNFTDTSLGCYVYVRFRPDQINLLLPWFAVVFWSKQTNVWYDLFRVCMCVACSASSTWWTVCKHSLCFQFFFPENLCSNALLVQPSGETMFCLYWNTSFWAR